MKGGAAVLRVSPRRMTGIVFNIMRFTVNDGPGIRTTVFLKGCPLHCLWCHNPEAISPQPELFIRADLCIRCGACLEACPHAAVRREDDMFVTAREVCRRCGCCVEACWSGARELVGREMTTEEVLEEVSRDTVFYDESRGGVTFSGGEPLLQHEFLASVLQGCRDRGIHTAVDTSGYAAPTVLDAVAEVADLFLYDFKLFDEERHRRFTGVSNRLILENLRRLTARKSSVIVRVPLIPGINDDDENIRAIGEFVASLGGISEIDVLPYHETGLAKYGRLGRVYALREVARPSPTRVEEVAALLCEYVATVGG